MSSFDDVLARARPVDGGDDVRIAFKGTNALRLEDVRRGALTADDVLFV